jgi:hypothetical protein
METWNVIGEEGSQKLRACHQELESLSVHAPGGGKVGSVDTVSLLLSWKQARGLSRMILDMAEETESAGVEEPLQEEPLQEGAPGLGCRHSSSSG